MPQIRAMWLFKIMVHVILMVNEDKIAIVERYVMKEGSSVCRLSMLYDLLGSVPRQQYRCRMEKRFLGGSRASCRGKPGRVFTIRNLSQACKHESLSRTIPSVT
jgi:hypothetical protein